MTSIRIQQAASHRLDDIYRYTRNQWGTEQADRYITGLFEAFEGGAHRTAMDAEAFRQITLGGQSLSAAVLPRRMSSRKAAAMDESWVIEVMTIFLEILADPFVWKLRSETNRSRLPARRARNLVGPIWHVQMGSSRTQTHRSWIQWVLIERVADFADPIGILEQCGFAQRGEIGRAHV